MWPVGDMCQRNVKKVVKKDRRILSKESWNKYLLLLYVLTMCINNVCEEIQKYHKGLNNVGETMLGKQCWKAIFLKNIKKYQTGKHVCKLCS